MKRAAAKEELSQAERDKLLNTLRTRFEEHPSRHKRIKWSEVEVKLKAKREKLRSLSEMERTGGEPDVIARDPKTGEYIFCDCSAETPKGRRSICYDPEALESRKEHKPAHSAIGMATAMGIAILSEDEYRQLQTIGEFDTKTSSWVHTPTDIRELGGALFCDRRYGHIFLYHNGAESYYAVRGFRASLRV